MDPSSSACWTRPTTACAKPSHAVQARGIGEHTAPTDDSVQPSSYAPVDIPPPNPLPGYDGGLSTPQNCHPCARFKVSPMSPLVQTSRVHRLHFCALYPLRGMRTPRGPSRRERGT